VLAVGWAEAVGLIASLLAGISAVMLLHRPPRA
jgi:hypothetical protein